MIKKGHALFTEKLATAAFGICSAVLVPIRDDVCQPLKHLHFKGEQVLSDCMQAKSNQAALG